MSSTALVLGRLAWRLSRRGALAVAVLCAMVPLAGATAYATVYPDPASRAALAATMRASHGVEAAFGQAWALDTTGGFTAWRSAIVIPLLVGVWAVLVSTRRLRGEEDRGGWDVLRAGRTTAAGAALATVGGLALAWLSMPLLVLALVLPVAGPENLAAPGVLLLALTVTGPGLVMLGIGAVCAQVATTRGQAAGLAGAVLGLCYLLRVAADAAAGLRWLRWLTPLGWHEIARPFGAGRAWVAVLYPVVAGALAGIAALLADRRDVGRGLLRPHDSRAPRLALLGSVRTLAVRQVLPSTAGWLLALVVAGVAVGAVSGSIAGYAPAGSQAAQLLERFSVGADPGLAYLGATFLLLAVAVAVLAAQRMAAAREEEAGGRLEVLLARPVTPAAWLGGHLLAALGSVVLVGASATLAGGAVARTVGVAFSPARLLATAAADLSPAVLVLGLATLALGIVPRATAAVGLGVVALGGTMELVGTLLDAPAWLLALSPFHDLAAAPAQPPDPARVLLLLAVGLVSAGAGVWALGRRDVVGA